MAHINEDKTNQTSCKNNSFTTIKKKEPNSSVETSPLKKRIKTEFSLETETDNFLDQLISKGLLTEEQQKPFKPRTAEANKMNNDHQHFIKQETPCHNLENNTTKKKNKKKQKDLLIEEAHVLVDIRENILPDSTTDIVPKEQKKKIKDNINSKVSKKNKLKAKALVENSPNEPNLRNSSENIDLSINDGGEKDSGEPIIKKNKTKKNNSLIEDEKQEKEYKTSEKLFSEAIKKSFISESQILMLRNLEVMVPFEIPILHALDKDIFRFPSLAKQQSLQDHGLTIKKGPFSFEEDRQIKKNWKKFCKIHEIPRDPTPFLTIKYPNNRVYLNKNIRIKFMQFLSHKLPDRMLYNVYQRFKLLYSKPYVKEGRFTKEEDKVIEKFLKEHCFTPERPIFELSKVLNRTKTSIKKRILLLESHSFSKMSWDQFMINKFIEELLAVTGCNDLYEFRTREITSDDYKKLSEKLNIPVKNLKHAWLNKIYMSLFIKDGSSKSINENKILLVKKLLENNEDDWNSLDLKKYTALFDNSYTHVNLYKFLKDMVFKFVPKHLRDNLKECLDILYDNIEHINSREIETYDYY